MLHAKRGYTVETLRNPASDAAKANLMCLPFSKLEQILGLNNIILDTDVLLQVFLLGMIRTAVKLSNNNNHTVASFWVFSTGLFTAACFHFKTQLDKAKFMWQNSNEQ